jgi:hypothetical protein
VTRARWTPADEAASTYDAVADNYDLTRDPRCLWGWGPPDCHHHHGHACFRAYGHPGRCGDPDEQQDCRRRRPADWDTTGRAEAGR